MPGCGVGGVPDVRRTRSLPHRLLRTQVMRGPARPWSQTHPAERLAQIPSDPEIGELQLPLGVHPQIGRLHVAMHHPGRLVRAAQRLTNVRPGRVAGHARPRAPCFECHHALTGGGLLLRRQTAPQARALWNSPPTDPSGPGLAHSSGGRNEPGLRPAARPAACQRGPLSWLSTRGCACGPARGRGTDRQARAATAPVSLRSTYPGRARIRGLS